jgi:hypothetical protein
MVLSPQEHASSCCFDSKLPSPVVRHSLTDFVLLVDADLDRENLELWIALIRIDDVTALMTRNNCKVCIEDLTMAS